MEDKEREKREKQIRLMVKLYFEKIDYLDENTLGEWTEKALNAFLDSDMEIDKINDIMAETFKNRREDFIMEREEEKTLNNTELKFMFVDNDNAGMAMQQQQENAKVLTKTNDLSDDSGFISNIIITTLALITFTLSGIGLALIYLLQ